MFTSRALTHVKERNELVTQNTLAGTEKICFFSKIIKSNLGQVKVQVISNVGQIFFFLSSPLFTVFSRLSS